MNDAKIQYATSADGTSIACTVRGGGPPLLRTPFGRFGVMGIDSQTPGYAEMDARLAQHFTLIRFDARGTGLSDRRVSDFSLDALAADIDAVVRKVGLGRMVLVTGGPHSCETIAYVAAHPGEVERLVIVNGIVRPAESFGGGRMQALQGVARSDWELYTEMIAYTLYGWSEGEEARKFAGLIRECVTQDNVVRAFEASMSFDVTALLTQIEAPTLVVQRVEENPFHDRAASKLIASHVPRAELAMVSSTSPGAFTASAAEPMYEFLGIDLDAPDDLPSPSDIPVPPATGAIHTIIFSDVENSTALTQQLGDVGARDVMRTHEQITREALREYGGSEVKSLGDGFMASFHSPTRALECAIAMQRAFAAHGDTTEHGIRLRIGINAGEPIAEDDDLFGTAVIMAARIAAQAQGGEIFVSDVVRMLVAGKSFAFEDRGEAKLKGFDAPARVHALRWSE